MEDALFFVPDEEVEAMVALLREKYSLDFSGYARTSLRRRLSRFKTMFRLRGTDELRFFLEESQEHLKLLVHEITVNTTEMFRDPEVWHYLRHSIIPGLADHNNIRIWHAGCSSGEEVYSLLILLEETGLLAKSKVYATDINEDVLALASEGRFRRKDFELFEMNYRLAGGTRDFASYFRPDGDHLIAREELRSPLHLKRFNLVGARAFSKFDIIFCRNVMIYFNAGLQKEVLRLFASSLFKSGLLVIGKKEIILSQTDDEDLFSPKNLTERIYALA